VMEHILRAVSIGCMVKLYLYVPPYIDIWASDKDSVFNDMETYNGYSISTVYCNIYGPLL
jgi:hypothetical protein